MGLESPTDDSQVNLKNDHFQGRRYKKKWKNWKKKKQKTLDYRYYFYYYHLAQQQQRHTSQPRNESILKFQKLRPPQTQV